MMSCWLKRAGLAAMLMCAGAAPVFATTPPALDNLFGGPFTLTDHTGAERSDKDYRGKFMLIYFGYTTCPSICPTNLQHMADAMDRLGTKGAGIVPIFVSIDPGRDRPDVLKEYVGHFGDGFVGLTGSEMDVRAIAKAYRVHRRKVVEKDAAPEDYLVDHASITYLMGPDGKFRTLFPHNTPGKLIAERISSYLAE